jgi:hypothetical protein
MAIETPHVKNTAAQALGRLGGSKNTDAQLAARRRNAKLAGRPRRVCVQCGAPVRGGHHDAALDTSCGAHGWRWQRQSEDDRPPVPADPALLADVLQALTRLARRPRRLIARVRRQLTAQG